MCVYYVSLTEVSLIPDKLEKLNAKCRIAELSKQVFEVKNLPGYQNICFQFKLQQLEPK